MFFLIHFPHYLTPTDLSLYGPNILSPTEPTVVNFVDFVRTVVFLSADQNLVQNGISTYIGWICMFAEPNWSSCSIPWTEMQQRTSWRTNPPLNWGYLFEKMYRAWLTKTRIYGRRRLPPTFLSIIVVAISVDTPGYLWNALAENHTALN